MGKRGKRQGRGRRGGGRRGGRGPAGGAGAGGGGGRLGASPAPPAGGWADLPWDLLETVARAVPAGDRLWFCLVCRRWAAAGAEVAPAAWKKALPAGELTRTYGPDTAASVVRAAEVMEGVLEGAAQKRFKNYMCQYSADGGHLEVLQ